MLIARLIVWLLVTLLGISTHSAWAQSEHDQHAPPSAALPEQLGEVHFPVSCNGAAQQEFNRAMALWYSFWFAPAKQSFGKVLAHDPKCGMAYWGTAISSMGNPLSWSNNPNVAKLGAPAMAEAQRVSANSERERDYIATLATFFTPVDTMDSRSRMMAFEKGMEGVVARYPEDEEAQILYAIILVATAVPTDKTFSHQLKAARMLEPLFKKHPRHPGIVHFLVHTYDYTGLAEQGLPAARAYATIAPSVPHALHMPSHIFSRLGLWPEMIKSNRASYDAAKNELSGQVLGVGSYDALHAMDYLVFGYLQQAQDKAAKLLVDEIMAIREVKVEDFAAAYALAAIPSRYALERGDWQQAAALTLSTGSVTWEKFPQAEAVLVFSRGLGATRTGAIGVARKDGERLQALREAMTAAKLNYWADQTTAQITTLNAWIALAEKRNEEAIQLMRTAAEAEEASDKAPVTPGNVVPLRELLGEMLLTLNQPAQAFTEFERSLQRDPDRFRVVYGASRAAEASGNRQAAREYYAKLQTLTSDRDTERPELAQATAFLAKQ
jgi:tetratricopeptide (TPR) repeat protein